MVTLNWSTAADWDAAQSERMVVHEDRGGRSASEVALGYPATDTVGPTSAPLHQYLPMDAAQGEPVQAVVGPSPDVTGTTAGATGVAGTNARTFDGNDQMVWYGISWTPPFSVSMYLKPTAVSSSQSFLSIGFDYNNQMGSFMQFAPDRLQVALGRNYYYGSVPIVGGEWVHIGMAVESDGTLRTTVNGTIDHDIAGSPPVGGWATRRVLGSEGWGNYFTGEIEEYRVYQRALSFEELSALAVSSGHLTTAAKTPS